MKDLICLISALLLVASPCAVAKSPKRGVCWDEKNNALVSHHSGLMSAGVSWAYNWGPDAAQGDAYSSEFVFYPMAWNGVYNATRIRQWCASHPESKYLLTFNEPNFADQARMTPAEAAAAWPGVRALAAELGLTIVAPALNFSNSQVGGRIWNPYEWYDEFFRLVPDSGIDCLAMHCYMNWYSPTTWLATEYFYSDLYDPRKDCYNKYPNLVAFLDRYKAEHGHFPRMMLTEFCSWENDGAIKSVDFQIDQMTQKVQKLEQSDLVEGYAWFMANAGAPASYPYMSMFETNRADATLSALGLVYVNMSDFDADRYFKAGETFAASDYVDATLDANVIRLRPNTESTSVMPLQIEIPAGGYPTYQIDVPADGEYVFTFHVNAANAAKLNLYFDMKRDREFAVPATSGNWTDITVDTSLKAGRHTFMLYNSGDNAVMVNSICFEGTNSITDVTAARQEVKDIYDCIGSRHASGHNLDHGIYIIRYADGSTRKIKI